MGVEPRIRVSAILRWRGRVLLCRHEKTGKEYWQHDLGGNVWGSPYYVDGKVYMGVDNGDLFIFAAGKEDKQLSKIEMLQGLKVPVVAAKVGSTLGAVKMILLRARRALRECLDRQKQLSTQTEMSG